MILERRLKPTVNVDLTPLIDVVFQLVIFFMITSVFKTTPGLPLNLPSAASAETTALAEIRILIRSESEIWVGKEASSLEGLPAAIRSALEGLAREQTQATVEGDEGASYGLMVAALDALRQNGISQVGLVTRKAPSEAAASLERRGGGSPP